MGDFGSVLASSASSAHLKGAEMSGSEVFWVKLAGFSMFWQFSVKSADAERVLKAETIVVDARGSVSCCDSKTACKIALFSCPVLAGGCGELAVVLSIGGCKMASLGVGRLAWTRTTLFVSSTTLGVEFSGVVLEKLGEISTFSTFGVKSGVF